MLWIEWSLIFYRNRYTNYLQFSYKKNQVGVEKIWLPGFLSNPSKTFSDKIRFKKHSKSALMKKSSIFICQTRKWNSSEYFSTFTSYLRHYNKFLHKTMLIFNCLIQLLISKSFFFLPKKWIKLCILRRLTYEHNYFFGRRIYVW